MWLISSTGSTRFDKTTTSAPKRRRRRTDYSESSSSSSEDGERTLSESEDGERLLLSDDGDRISEDGETLTSSEDSENSSSGDGEGILKEILCYPSSSKSSDSDNSDATDRDDNGSQILTSHLCAFDVEKVPYSSSASILAQDPMVLVDVVHCYYETKSGSS